MTDREQQINTAISDVLRLSRALNSHHEAFTSARTPETVLLSVDAEEWRLFREAVARMEGLKESVAEKAARRKREVEAG